MNYFARILKHYITYILGLAGGLVDSDTHAELDGAMRELDNHIEERINRLIKLHEQVDHGPLNTAAPDLLIACKTFVTAWETSHQLEKTDVALRMAKAAIEKAEPPAGVAERTEVR